MDDLVLGFGIPRFARKIATKVTLKNESHLIKEECIFTN